MFNLLITSDEEGWATGRYVMSRSRSIVEYTAPEIIERYRDLNKKNIEELKKFPCLFVVEGEPVPSLIGYITGIRLRDKEYVIEFKVDNSFPPLPPGTIKSIRADIDVGEWELSRTHWAIKDEPLFEVLLENNFVTKENIQSSYFYQSSDRFESQSVNNVGMSQYNNQQVFIVHGHDEITRLQVEDFLRSINIEPIVLSQQPSSGKTIIEKIEHYSNVGFGVVLYTECDIGAKKDSLVYKHRARQNVVFEHGFLIGKLTRNRVAALVKGNVETPNDISGVVYISIDESERWKNELTQEMRVVGYNI
ncbi:TPA: nucleotide-binding protein [Enterobacter cloacae]|nr:nucleotide-binding protein [Enterobacter cloacae]